MKKLLLFALILCLGASVVFAAVAPKAGLKWKEPPAGQKFMVRGHIVDNNYLDLHKKDIASFAKKYNKESALVQKNIKSGYSIYTYRNKLFTFDRVSNDKIKDFLMVKGNTTNVIVNIKRTGKTVNLISINNLK